MKKIYFLPVYLICSTLFITSSWGQEKKYEKKEDIKIAVQTWSFNRYTFAQAVEKAASLGFRYIEMFPSQKINSESDATTYYKANKEERDLMKEILNKNNVTLVNYGVVGADNKEDWIQLFEFAKVMGIKTIISEPTEEFYGLIDSLTQAYSINLAVHNHATGTYYWDPKIVLKNVKDLNLRVGVCPDNGHWMRSGLDPVESLKLLKGRVVTLHLKDMNDFDNLEAHTVPLGTGKMDLHAYVEELNNQGFSGVITIENEYNWETPEDDLKVSLGKIKELLE